MLVSTHSLLLKLLSGHIYRWQKLSAMDKHFHPSPTLNLMLLIFKSSSSYIKSPLKPHLILIAYVDHFINDLNSQKGKQIEYWRL